MICLHPPISEKKLHARGSISVYVEVNKQSPRAGHITRKLAGRRWLKM
jgi:hypothetical protein